MRLAEASFAAWIMIRSSIRFRSTGSQPVCTRKTSAPRIDSPNRQYVSPFANEPIVTSPSSTTSRSPIFWASSRCDRPEKSISRFCGPRSSDGERAGRDILGDDRSRRNPSTLANLDRSNECILDAGPDVARDRRAALRLPGFVRIVHGDVPRGDVRALADLGVADVREVRNLRPRAHARVLDLHERARLRV